MLLLRPHLYWGGTTCPGNRWPEWVPNLRDSKEDHMTPEQEAELRLLREQVNYLVQIEREYRITQGQVHQLIEQVGQLLVQPTGAGYTDAQAVKAVRDKLD